MNNLIQVIKVLESDEVKKLNEFIDTLDFKQNTLIGSSDFIDDKMRSSTGSFLDDDHELTKSFHLKINQALDEYKRRLINIHENFQYYPVPGGYDTHSWRENIQILQYENNQEYKFHTDQAQVPERSEFFRTISVIVYLTDNFEGGETSFVHTSFKPELGHALIFPSNWCYPHAGRPVTKGFKRVAVTWYYVALN